MNAQLTGETFATGPTATLLALGRTDPPSDDEALRVEHLTLETAIRGLGVVYCGWGLWSAFLGYLGLVALGAGGPAALVEGISARYGLQAAESARMVAGNLTSEVTVLLFACSALLGILGLRLFRLQPGARIPAALFAVPGLAALFFFNVL